MAQQLDVRDAVARSEDVGRQAMTIADSTKERDLLWRQGCRQHDLLGWEARRLVQKACFVHLRWLRPPCGRSAQARFIESG